MRDEQRHRTGVELCSSRNPASLSWSLSLLCLFCIEAQPGHGTCLSRAGEALRGEVKTIAQQAAAQREDELQAQRVRLRRRDTTASTPQGNAKS